MKPALPRLQRASLVVVAVGLVAIAVGTAFYLFASDVPRIDPANANQVERGRRLYVAACASCHGSSLEGQPNWQRRLPNGRLPAPPHDETGHTWHHSDAFLMRITQLGPAAYPGRQSPISLTIRIYGDFSHGLLPIPAEIPAS